MEKTLTIDEKYQGKYVALKGYDDTTVVGSGGSPEEALQDAKKNGFLKPYIIYVPEKEMAPVH